MTKAFDVAVIGATGAVGEALIALLEEREFPVDNLHLLASERTVGTPVEFRGALYRVHLLDEFDFSDAQIGFFCAGGEVSAEYAPRAAAAGCIVIDSSSQFRRDMDIPLVVPEANADVIAGYANRGIIANPNCATILMVTALKPVYDAVGIERINVCTYEPVSETGKEAIEELAGQTAALLNGRPIEPRVYPKQIAFNVLPQVDEFQDNGYTKKEMDMIWETRKVLGDETIGINPMAVRVPVFYGHSAAVHVETREKMTADWARELWRKAPGVEVLDEHKPGGYPTPATDSVGKDRVYVGRIREDISHPRGLDLWLVSDNTRKGSALNSIEIAEHLVKNYL